MRVFDALAAPMRLQILRLVSSHGPLSYSEIMAQLNLNPNRDAGKFAYHLRTLHNCGLLTTEKESKKYSLSPMGALMLEMSQRIDTESLREGGRLLVRTSRAAMEEFDHNRIVQALVREAGVPVELARKVAEETEERLLKLDTLYLTAPLIREFVNAVLIEKGLHEYRHKLTRLGLPVHDVSQLLGQDASSTSIQDIHRIISRNVLAEYVLLNVLPRRVADAHLAGLLQVNDVDSWVLGPQSIQHDLRVFLRSGFRPGLVGSASIALDLPRDLSEALAVISSFLWNCSREVVEEQTLNHFNVFLAPFAKGEGNDLHALLRQFLVSIDQALDRSDSPAIALGLDFTVPHSLEKLEAIGSEGRICGNYRDYNSEAQKILETLIDLLMDDAEGRPIFYPRLILNVTAEDIVDNDISNLLLKAHSLASDRGTPVFINRQPEWQRDAVYHSNGLRLASTWSDDWELDCLRTGVLGSVGINLPRIAYDSKGMDSRVFSLLDDCLGMVTDALRVKAAALYDLLTGGLLPCLSQSVMGEPYFRLENAPFLVGLVGLNEAVKIQTGKQLHESSSAKDFASRLLAHLSSETAKIWTKSGYRMALAYGASEEAPQRFAELDVENYGWGTVFAQGTRESPYYTDLTVSPLEAPISLEDRVTLEGRFQPLFTGGHLLPLELAEPKQTPEALLATTRDIVASSNLGAFAYSRTYGYCANCGTILGGQHQKCPQCNAFKTYTTFGRLSSNYQSLNDWPTAKVYALDKRHRYWLDKKK
jgi:anaerobic ribonucleoside-triphosphate reductase